MFILLEIIKKLFGVIVRKYIFHIIIITYILLGGCKDISPSSAPDGDYIVFGSFYGECFGEQCVEIFKYEGGVLSEDSLDRYPSITEMPYNGKYYKIANKYPAELRELLAEIPSELLASQPSVFGMPDAHDQGGMIIQLKVDGQVKYWLLDNLTERLPEYLRNYAAELKSVLSKIRN